MIVGIGVDLIEIERVEKSCQREHFFARCFSIEERELIGGNYTTAAGNWAVKEAVAKSFGTGVVGFELTDIVVLRNHKGAPYVELKNGALDIANNLEIKHIHVSISNTKDHAIAYVICESTR